MKKTKRGRSQNDESSPQEATPPQSARYEDDEGFKRKRRGKVQAEESTPRLQSSMNHKALTEVAKKVLLAPPCKASDSPETHKWQQLFIHVEFKKMPSNDKMNDQQELVISEEVAEKALQYAHAAVKSFPVPKGRRHTEENDQPRLINLAIGCAALIGPQEVEIQTGPVRYMQVDGEMDGEMSQDETSPPGFSSSIDYEKNKTFDHGDGSKSWKMDMVFFSKVAGKQDQTPRIHVEAKGGEASELDLYQASLAGNNLLLQRLQDGEDIERLYLEVWGTSSYTYGILDVLGFITVDRGVVTDESFRRYSRQISARSELMGFPSDTLARLPKTIEAFQSDYDKKADAFYDKYRCQLPSRSGIQDFPVGVVYLSEELGILPTGRLFQKHKRVDETRSFIQSHIKILGSNSALFGDNVNEKLLASFEKFEKENLDV